MEIKKQKKFKCVFCHKYFDGYGNNAQPIKEGTCCDLCNEEVITEKIRRYNAVEI